MEYFTMSQPNDFNILISVDIGLTGGIAFFDWHSKELVGLYEMPSEKITTKSGRNKGQLNVQRVKFILEIPKKHGDTAMVIMENVHAFPGQGVVAMATLMEQKGIIRGICTGLEYEEYLVEPKAWQSYYGMIPPKDLKGSTGSKTKTLRKKWLKDKSVEIAENLFPEWKDKMKKSNGMSDAMLIGNYKINHPLT